MISVAEALERLLALAPQMQAEPVGLRLASGRVLAAPVVARRDQPPFAASAMDGYALSRVEAERDAQFKVIGEAAAGHRFQGRVGPGQAVRIFTGAPLPDGADFVVIQEDATQTGSTMTITNDPGESSHVRPAGGDFRTGDTISAPRVLGPRDIALIAAMNVPVLEVARRPVVAIMATGDELVMPGEAPGPDQIVASNTFGLCAMLDDLGAIPRLLPIARDHPDSLAMILGLAREADLVLTVGGASVGDHDLVADVAAGLGMDPAFYKIAMRPGKPLMAGRLGAAMMMGLPGNPVSAMVCGHVFVAPVIRHMLGLPAETPALRAPLGEDVGANGPRAHYMRARLSDGALQVFERQDSALLSVLSEAQALVIRPPHDPARQAGDLVTYLPL